MIKDLGLAIGLVGVILAPMIVLGGLAVTSIAVLQHMKKKSA